MSTPVRLPWCSDRRNREPAAPTRRQLPRGPRSSMEAITTTSCVQVGREDVHAPALAAGNDAPLIDERAATRGRGATEGDDARVEREKAIRSRLSLAN